VGTLKYKSLRGMPDIQPKEAVLMRGVEETAYKVLSGYGFNEVRTPLLEETDVFVRSIGQDTDIVGKEMYSFTTASGSNISLRPEGTASIIRALIQHSWHNLAVPVKMFYSGPMFRAERPQKGRLRQFHQIGAEIIGSDSPIADAELILSLNAILKSLGLEGFNILVNTLGCKKDRDAYKKELKTFLSDKIDKLCDNCTRRADNNVMRVLDCKSEKCARVLKDAPSIIEYVCQECLQNYKDLKEILSATKIDFAEKKDIVRGLDYYTGTVFEVTHASLGSKDAVAAGGRYDNLTLEMGGPSLPAAGYAIGVDRLMLLLGELAPPAQTPDVLVTAVTPEFAHQAFVVAEKLRDQCIPCEMDYSGRSLKGQMRKAHKDGKKHIIMLGDQESKENKLLVKNMDSGEQVKVTFEEAVAIISRES